MKRFNQLLLIVLQIVLLFAFGLGVGSLCQTLELIKNLYLAGKGETVYLTLKYL